MSWRGFRCSPVVSPSVAYDEVATQCMTLLQCQFDVNLPFKGWYLYRNRYGRFYFTEWKSSDTMILSGGVDKERIKMDYNQYLDESISVIELVWGVVIELDPHLKKFPLVTVAVFDYVMDTAWTLRNRLYFDQMQFLIQEVMRLMKETSITNNDESKEEKDGYESDGSRTTAFDSGSVVES